MASKVVEVAAKAAAAESATQNAKRLYNKVFFPNEIITLMHSEKIAKSTEPAKEFKVKINPRLTRTETKNWIEALYDTAVKKVNTLNYEGKIKRIPGGKGYYKRPDYKVAYVTLDQPWLPSINKK